MVAEPTLLVVDDEEIICQGCRRVLSCQGFQVETTNEAVAGLTLASERDYDAILLDITMPQMDGVEFLERLRERKPEVPVIVITGNPTIRNAASAVRLGADDYITKPFTPEAIVQSVRRLVRQRPPEVQAPMAQEEPADESAPLSEGLRFWDEAWMEETDGAEWRLGALLSRGVGAVVQSVRLPRMGETVYQGLPLAGLVLSDGSTRSVPAPISGVVTTVNSVLANRPGTLMQAARHRSWIAAVSPTRLDDEQARCRYRRVLLLNPDEASATQQSELLVALGCRVVVAGAFDERLRRAADHSETVIIIDAARFGERGPALVKTIVATDPDTRVVVSAEDSEWESEYRRSGIYYYALKPFTDGEIVEILDGAFRRPRNKPLKAEISHGVPTAISKICITNRNRTKVCLLVEGGLIQKDHGLGQHIARGLLDRLFPVEVTLGTSGISTTRVLKAAGAYQKVIVLLTRDSGRLPGALAQHSGEFVHVTGPDAGRVVAFVVQPEPGRSGPLKLDERTTAALGDYIVDFMARA